MKEQLIERAMKIEEKLTQLRGYESGMTRKAFNMLSESDLIRCNKINERTLKKHGISV